MIIHLLFSQKKAFIVERILYIFFLLTQSLPWIPSHAVSQEFIYFNNRYDISGNGSNDWISNVLEIDKRFIITGTSKDYNSPNQNWFMSILSIDKQGNIVSSKTIADAHSNYIFESPGGTIIEYNSSTLYAAGVKRTYTSNWVHDQGMLICFNKQLDTLWCKFYGEEVYPFDTAFLFYQIKKTTQNDLIMTGVWMPYEGPSYVWLVKTDNSGNTIWEKSFGNGYYYYHGYSVIQTSDGGYAIGAYVWELGNNNSGDPIVIKTDSMGNQEWIKNLGWYYVDHVAMLCNSDDGNIIVGTSIADSMLNPLYSYYKTTLVKLNNSGDIIWQKKYGGNRLGKILLNTQKTTTGDFLMSGLMFNNFPHQTGWILKIDSGGDSLWFREYDYLVGEDSENQLKDVIETNDNGIISCGIVNPRDPDTGTRDFWVIKLDGTGCPFPDCDTTVGEVEIPHERTDELMIYPNPAAEWLQVTGSRLQVQNRRSANSNRQPTMYLCIYDIYGRKMEEIVVAEGRDQMRFDVSGYQNGIYLVVLSSESQIIGRKKFIVAR